MSKPSIISGQAKRANLKSPDSARPITGRIKQSLFDLLTPYLKDARVLDLYAGSGSLGIEALSRGAAYAVFVELDPDAAKAIQRNLIATKFSQQAQVVNQPVEVFLRNPVQSNFDIIFVDPPFEHYAETDLSRIASLLNSQGIIAFRQSSKKPTIASPQSLHLTHSQKYGVSKLLFFVRQDDRVD